MPKLIHEKQKKTATNPEIITTGPCSHLNSIPSHPVLSYAYWLIHFMYYWGNSAVTALDQDPLKAMSTIHHSVIKGVAFRQAVRMLDQKKTRFKLSLSLHEEPWETLGQLLFLSITNYTGLLYGEKERRESHVCFHEHLGRRVGCESQQMYCSLNLSLGGIYKAGL